MRIFYFSATGNSLYVAKKIKQQFEDCTLTPISTAYKNKEFCVKEETIGFIYPIHCGGVPILVYNYLSRLNLPKDVYIFAIGVSGGGTSIASFYQLNKLLNRNIDNYLSIKYISNYTKSGRNPTDERLMAAIKREAPYIDTFIEEIKLKKHKSLNYKFVIHTIANLGYKLFKDVLKNKDKNFNTNNNCTSCGICKKICPINNITLKNGKPNWNGNCIDCMACINNCPAKAINIGKSTIKKNRIRNPYIKVDELINN